jgi:hypothetical protein
VQYKQVARINAIEEEVGNSMSTKAAVKYGELAVALGVESTLPLQASLHSLGFHPEAK